MKGDNPYLMRALYIILVPLVLLTILLNSGWLQRLFPAASVHGETYSVVRYNFYYYDVLNTFLEENAGSLDQLGYDPQQSAGNQTRPDGITWKEWFQQQAEANLSQTAYYCTLAQAADYQFSAAELAPIAETLAKQAEQRALYNISASNYYSSYYGAGMDEDSYTEELTRVVQAQAYKAYLTASSQPSQAELDQWLSQNPAEDYRTVDMRVITLEALPDRATGETGPDQLAALSAKLDRLMARYQSGADFAQLQAAFSTCALGDASGVLTAAGPELPAVLADWCLSNQEELAPGDLCAVLDGSGTAYFAVLDRLGGSGREAAAAAVLRAEMVAEQELQALPDYQVTRNSLGMLLAAA